VVPHIAARGTYQRRYWLTSQLVEKAADYRMLKLGYAVLASAYRGKLVRFRSNLLTGKSTKPITPLYVK
jgi:hypothetical protein